MDWGIPMEFGPGVPLPGLFGVRVVYPVWIIGAWIVLVPGWAILITGFDWLLRRFSRSISRARSDTWTAPQPDRRRKQDYTVEYLEEVLEEELGVWRRQARVAVRSIVGGPLLEEPLFRGIPLLIALTFTGQESLIWLLLGGHVIWAYGHRFQSSRSWRPVLGTFVGGLLELYLWLIGLWWLGVLVHGGHNAIVRAHDALRTWRRRRREAFRPGEERMVTIPDPVELPMSEGLYGVAISEHERIYVADLKPGETARVRIAHSSGNWGYAIPLHEPVSGP